MEHIKNFKNRMVSAIHTVQINTSDFFTLKHEVKGVSVLSHVARTGEIITLLKVNPSKFIGHEITKLKEFKITVVQILSTLGISNYKLSRLDLKHDFIGSGDFDRFQKINRVLVLLVSINNNLNNRFESKDFLTLENLNIKAKNDYFEIENYNREVERFSGSPVTSRLEMRTLRLYKKKNVNIEKIIYEWHSKLRMALTRYSNLQEAANIALKNEYFHEIQENRAVRINDFLRRYEGHIYTRQQLISLLEILGINNPEIIANNFSQRNNIQYIGHKLLKEYVEEIIASDLRFIS